MNTYLDCVPCFVRQALEAARMATDDIALHEQMLRKVLRMVSEMSFAESPPKMGQLIHRMLRDLTHNRDPYAAVKKRFNDMALKMLPKLRKAVSDAPDPFAAAVRLAIAGNIIDFGPKGNITEQEALAAIDQALSEPLHGDIDQFRNAVEQSHRILYLADNAGEIVFDRILIEQLLSKRLTLVVRGVPVINDATIEDAEAVGLMDMVEVVGNGSDAPGTILTDCDAVVRDLFRTTDLVISKGQGNFETLSEESSNIFFLFKAKCPIIATHTRVPLGAQVLLGHGSVN